MSEQKKFGTFSGVFTPALLTILGVIMYLRLPWLVGQAGLYSAIGIILIAHIISITTGLSVASIATDKKVKVGGVYYMISRSLGLPIGGTLGLALFIGLSFSVSLYLIGFSESLLGFLDFPVTKNNIRLLGSASLVLVTIITLISTSLALKTQFLILIAIALSLGSIVMGRLETVAQTPHFLPSSGSPPFIVLFGIFFPAVTGFTAGVNMSGDLDNPKRSIPLGTMAAIFAGLIVYIALAIFFSIRVPADQLINDSNILNHMAFFPPLVLAGIWGATLSSAMGSILGAPRTLQAISLDKITPRFFGRGYGKENEPRNALLLTFILAESGILIGELDVIARVVSMFFITIYGFLNLSCAIEDWASPDFQPDFRVSRWISTIGAVTCLVVMIQLDLLAMIAATLLLASIFFYLKRKELTLESGDTWEGVWSSVIRTGLQHLNRHIGQRRNWRPNIILFSGGTSSRPHLIDIGKRLVDKRGVLSNFDLIETAGSQMLFRKSEQSIRDETDEYPGVFSRRIECDDVYSAIETISKYYGFSGLEPNTILMGWGKNSQKPEKFVHLLRTMINLDYNLMLLNYDEKRGFGNRQHVDVWWGGLGNNIALALSLCRYLVSSDEWRGAQIRFLTITDDSSKTEELFRNMNQLISDFRIEATVKVINNVIEKRPFYEIMKEESRDADLTINGIPEVANGEEQVFVSKNNSVIEYLGTVLLIHASSFFEDVDVGVNIKTADTDSNAAEAAAADLQLEYVEALSKGAAISVAQLAGRLSKVNTQLQVNYLKKMLELDKKPIEALRSKVENCFESIEKGYLENERVRNHRLIIRSLGDLLFQVNRVFGDLISEQRSILKDSLEEGIQSSLSLALKIPSQIPATINVIRSSEITRLEKTDSLSIKTAKLWKRSTGWILRKPVRSTIQFGKLANQFISIDYLDLLQNSLKSFHQADMLRYPQLQTNIDHVVDSLGKMGSQLISGDMPSADGIVMERQTLLKEIDTIADELEDRFKIIIDQLTTGTRDLIKTLTTQINNFDSHKLLRSDRWIRKQRDLLAGTLDEIPGLWIKNDEIMAATTIMDLSLLSFRNRVSTVVRRYKDNNRLAVSNGLLDELEELSGFLQDFKPEAKIPSFNVKDLPFFSESWSRLAEEVRSSINDLVETVDIGVQEEADELPTKGLVPVQTKTVSLRRLVDYFFESNFFGPMEDKFAQVVDQFQKVLHTSKDIYRLISIQQHQEGDETTESFDVETVIKGALERMTDALDLGKITLTEFEQSIDECLRDTFENLNLFSIADSATHMDRQMRDKRGSKVVTFAKIWFEQFSRRLVDFNTSLIYRRASALTYLKRRSLEKEIDHSDVDRLLEFVESVSPQPEVVNQLPFYYKHIFLGKPVITKDFWIGRQEELLQGSKALKRFNSGHLGGIAIVGEPGSGKTALSRYIANRHFEKQRIYQLNPPEEGAIDVDYFHHRLKELFEKQGSVEHILQGLPSKSALILDDIGSWWERSTEGFKVINDIFDLLKQAGDNCFFIVNADNRTFQLMNDIQPIEHNFLDIIHCMPYDIESLKQIVLMRHRSTGLKFQYHDKDEEQMSQWQLARMFTQIYKNGSGNISLALQRWIQSITAVNEENLIIDHPSTVSEKALDHLNLDQLTFCAQLLLHRRLKRDRLIRIFEMDAGYLDDQIRTLKRSGILVEKSNGVFYLNTDVQPFLLQKTIEKGLI
jgi:amino acid transporter/DNA replication protein DnaC